MTYSLEFHPDALEEWDRLPRVAKERFKAKLKERLKNPHVPKSRLSGGKNIYKIKFKQPPFRLTYHVNDKALIVTTVSIGKRDGKVYSDLLKRLTP